jgi:hypothetical protein
MAKLGDFLTRINVSKHNIMEDEPLTEKEYVPFVINRTLSYFPDTVMYANELNTRSHLDNKLQFDYLLNSIRAKKRFSRWLKNDEDVSIEVIKEYYSCSYRKAREIAQVLSGDQLSLIYKRMERGGLNGKRKSR